ncbi:hypothetical protein [Mixta calida]|uniref:hypothetical protein n=1 Tax=Mixta calida TaxID=665913 RepID=UPI0034D514C9
MDKALFASLLTSMAEMVAIERGELTPAEENVHRHPVPAADTPQDKNPAAWVSKGNPLARD